VLVADVIIHLGVSYKGGLKRYGQQSLSFSTDFCSLPYNSRDGAFAALYTNLRHISDINNNNNNIMEFVQNAETALSSNLVIPLVLNTGTVNTDRTQ